MPRPDDTMLSTSQRKLIATIAAAVVATNAATYGLTTTQGEHDRPAVVLPAHILTQAERVEKRVERLEVRVEKLGQEMTRAISDARVVQTSLSKDVERVERSAQALARAVERLSESIGQLQVEDAHLFHKGSH